MTRSVTIEDLYRISFLSKPRISPDGQRVACVATTIDEHKHQYRSAIWMVQSDGMSQKRFTFGKAKATNPVWSPDGRWLAFVSEREGESVDKDNSEQKKQGKGKAQIWLIPTDGGEARQLTFMPHGAASPVWSPDSQRIVFCAPVGPLDEEDEDGKPLPKARVIDRLWYRLDGVGYIYERRQHLFLIDVNGAGETQQLTDGDWDDSDAAWSPDGTQLAFTSSREADRWRLPCSDVYTLSLADGQASELRRLTDGSISCGVPSWSPDGKTIAFLAALKVRSANHVDLYTIASSGPGTLRCLTTEFEGSCMDWTNSDMSDDHLMIPPAWSADGKTLYMLAAQRGASRVFAVPSTGTGNQIATLTPGNVHVMDFSASSASDKLALLMEDPTHIGEIFLCSTATPGELQKLTSFNDALLHELSLSTPEYMLYTGEDGWPMDGWIMKPQNFDPANKYPLIVEIHGGPNTQYGFGFFHEMQLLVALGNVVLYTNPRGSCGYGREFALAVRGDWGTKDSLDIMAGVDALLQKGYIDEQRMGVTGGSYGGFMTNWLIGHNNRFKVAVTDRSVTNLASDFGSGDFGWTFADDELETTPWDNLDRYMQHSPIKYVKNIQTPLLIIHSEQDLRCNIEQAEQLFASLKYLGREVRFVRFEGQSHGLSRGGHPKLRVERLKHIMGWFEQYLKN